MDTGALEELALGGCDEPGNLREPPEHLFGEPSPHRNSHLMAQHDRVYDRLAPGMIVEEDKRLARALRISARHGLELRCNFRDLLWGVEIVVTLPRLRMAPPFLPVSPVEPEIKYLPHGIKFLSH